jgi:FlaA1/EpsC-like NDP-sugar epimerase
LGVAALTHVGHDLDAHVLERIRLHGLTFARDAVVVGASYVAADYLKYFPKAIPNEQLGPFLVSLPVIVFTYMLCMYLFGVHRRLWQYAGVRDVRALVEATIVATLGVFIADVALYSLDLTRAEGRPVPLAAVIVGGVFSLSALAGARLWPRLFQPRSHSDDGWARFLIVGAGQGGNVVAADLLANPQWHQLPIGFVDDDLSKRRRRIHNVPVLGTIDRLPEIAAMQEVDVIGVAIPSASTKELDRILALAQQTTARIQVLPTIGEIMTREVPLRLRDINLDDLLNRAPSTQPQSHAIAETISDRVVLVTGAAGSIGSELCRQILRFKPSRLIALDNNETGLFYLERDLSEFDNRGRLQTVLGDITDITKLSNVISGARPSIVFHAAAYKHVPILEAHPEEAIFVNVQGTLNVCRLVAEYECERFVFVSTDKAVHPVNALGFSKRLGELITRAHHDKGPIFCSVRFGNVMGSRGSALPEFIRQIDSGGPVLVTHPDVERYFMTIPESVSLVIQAGAMARGSEIFMLDMGEPVKIDDLAKRIIRMRGLRVGADIEIRYTGLRPGEKLTEELVFRGERDRPTDNPSIVAVEDDMHCSLEQLEARVHLLAGIAASGRTDVVRETLREAAEGRLAPISRSLETAR